MRRSVKRAEAEVTCILSEIDLVELGMLLWISKCIRVNGEPATQEFIKLLLEEMTGKEIRNWNGDVQDMKRRKNPVAWLTISTRQLQGHLERLADDRRGWK